MKGDRPDSHKREVNKAMFMAAPSQGPVAESCVDFSVSTLGGGRGGGGDRG